MPTEQIDLTCILDTRQRSFVQHWKGDAVEAARAAGYSDPQSAAFNLLQHGLICELIRKKRAPAEESDKASSWRFSFCLTDVVERLWALANTPPRETGEPIAGQVRAAEVLAGMLVLGNDFDTCAPGLFVELPARSQLTSTHKRSVSMKSRFR